ncbi:MAG: HD domain-containing protein [Candidatus Lokiarchaeota archaeon]|nr:HD domain-containing protein [Candidatus Lokiarchaeota archaeon]
MDPDILKIFRLHMRKDSDIGPKAISDSDAVRFYKEDEESEFDIRPPFFRDVDRIVHSKAYARYIDKTQVFFGVSNANITHRSLHVILVSRIARQIGRILKLNTDLIEAIALAHDIGHTPFGHLGEQILDEICKEYNMGNFNHNAQGVRWLSYLEKRFPKEPAKGLNLTLQVLDGILSHNGEITERELRPVKVNGKTWQDHFNEYEDAFNKNSIIKIPMSYEGIAVRFADTISYIGRDFEDAILLKFINREDMPIVCKNVLGDTNRTIMKTLIMDLLTFSLDNNKIGYSEPVFEALKEMKKFNYEKIYIRRDLTVNGSEINFLNTLREKFRTIFKISLKDLEHKDINSPIFKDHIEYIDDNKYSTYFTPHKEQNKLTLIARDYIAGMSDKYFNDIYLYYKNKTHS